MSKGFGKITTKYTIYLMNWSGRQATLSLAARTRQDAIKMGNAMVLLLANPDNEATEPYGQKCLEVGFDRDSVWAIIEFGKELQEPTECNQIALAQMVNALVHLPKRETFQRTRYNPVTKKNEVVICRSTHDIGTREEIEQYKEVCRNAIDHTKFLAELVTPDRKLIRHWSNVVELADMAKWEVAG